jgi:hypothetical protein
MRWTSARALLFFASVLILYGCGGGANSSSSTPPVSPEPAYYGTPTAVSDPVTVTVPVKFHYRKLDFNPSAFDNGLGELTTTAEAIPVSFAEFHIYNSSGTRIQQGETTTDGNAIFNIPKTTGNYTLKVYSRALNNYLKISVLEDIYANTPYSISKSFTISSADISAGTLDLSSSPLYAQADENISARIEGAAFNVMFQVLIANEFIRRNIGKNGDTPGVPSTDPNKWWVASKVSVYWKAGFNPYTYFNYSAPLSFYVPGDRKLYLLGGSNGDVSSADTDHFDDSIILHEYAHFLEDVYGSSQSPGGSHNGDFVIDPRLAWSEGWANFFQSAVLTGADAYDNSASENRLPTNKRFQYYVDTYGNKSGGSYGIGIAFDLAAVGSDLSEPDSVGTDTIAETGIFREVSVSRTLYKSTRNTSSNYATSKPGGGVSFATIWKTFSGEDTLGHTSLNPVEYSLRKTSVYPIANAGLFNWLLEKNGVNNTEWTNILDEENQRKLTSDYGYNLNNGSCSYTFTKGIVEQYMSSESVPRSNQQINNDFYLYYHDGSSSTLSMSYTGSLNLDLILYSKEYVYFEDSYWYAGQSSKYIARQSRNVSGSESVNLSGLAKGFYILNVKINAYNKTTSSLNNSTTYRLYKNGVQLCGSEQ